MLYTANSEPSELYREWVGVFSIASVLRRKCFLPWLGTDTFYPNLYVVLVGPAGARKGTAMRPGVTLMRKMGINMSSASITREALILQLKDSQDTEVDTDAGTMTLNSSLSVVSEELTVFLGYNNPTLLSDLCDWFDCPDIWEYKTKNSGIYPIDGVWLSILGATTPLLLQSTLPAATFGSGLSSRIIYVYSAGKAKRVPFPFLTEQEAQLGLNLELDLERIKTLRGKFEVTTQFLAAYGEWYHTGLERSHLNGNQYFEGYMNRRQIHLLKLCMVMSVMQDTEAAPAMLITTKIFDRALDLLMRTEEQMGWVFQGVGSGSSAVVQSKIMTVLTHHKTITRKGLLQAFYADLNNEAHLDEVMNTLVAMGFCKKQLRNRDNAFIYTLIPKEEDGNA